MNKKEPLEGDTFLAGWIAQIFQERGIQTAIETGTQTGATAEYFASLCPDVWTCDVAPMLDRVLPPNVRFVQQSSPDFLMGLLPSLNPATTFVWLDAHVAPQFTMIEEELAALAMHRFRCVIGVHDFFTGNPDHGFDTYTNIGPLSLGLVRAGIDSIYGLGCWEFQLNTDACGARRGVAMFFPKA